MCEVLDLIPFLYLKKRKKRKEKKEGGRKGENPCMVQVKSRLMQ
jgi:hypothetical protein